ALKNVVEVTGLPIERVVRTTAHNQAEELGLGDVLGKLEPGYQADIVVLDKDSFDVERVYIKGVCKKCNC
ncbi:MAG: amidohydrolase family protein, partial [Kiritimatiellae bacterium]|nr:amidohydrolase family protein [Kiritimatiellia bacterium]